MVGGKGRAEWHGEREIQRDGKGVLQCLTSWSVWWTQDCELANERTWEQFSAQVGSGTACPKSTDCAAGEGGCVDPDGEHEL